MWYTFVYFLVLIDFVLYKYICNLKLKVPVNTEYEMNSNFYTHNATIECYCIPTLPLYTIVIPCIVG